MHRPKTHRQWSSSMKQAKLLKTMKLSEEDVRAIRTAVSAGEKGTRGEIAVALTGESADYSFNELFASVLVGAAIFSALIPAQSAIHGMLTALFWHVPVWGAAAFTGAATFTAIGLFFLLANTPGIDRLIIPRQTRSRMVYTRALRHFVESGVYATRERTGILIFISAMEHEVRILADKGISDKIDQSVWNALAEKLAAGVRNGTTAAALIETITGCGAILTEHFPAGQINENELVDGLVLLESGS